MRGRVSWECPICNGIHIKWTDLNFNCFEYVCVSLMQIGSYFVVLNKVKCLCCSVQQCTKVNSGRYVVVRNEFDFHSIDIVH
jgi:hypothetical protein